MIFVALILTTISISVIYTTVIKEKKELLKELSMNQSGFIRSLYKQNNKNEILDIFKKQQGITKGIGETGEFIIAYLQNDTVFFVLSRHNYNFALPNPQSYYTEKSIPIKNIISKKNIFINGFDYRGRMVLAYTDFIPKLNWWTIAKTDISEVRQPFYRAGFYALISCILLILTAMLIFKRISAPVIKKIIAREKQIALITDNIPDCIANIDKDQKYLFVNQRYADWYKKNKEEIIGKKIEEIISKENLELTKPYIKSVLAGKTVSFETPMSLPDGKPCFAHIFLVPMFNEKGKVTAFSEVIHDITARKKAEEQLEKYALDLKCLNATKDKFFGIIAHDLKNPFSSLIGTSELLAENAHNYDCEKIKKLSEIMNNSAKYGYDLLENLLEWAKMQISGITFYPEKIDLKEITEKNINNLKAQAENKRIDLQLDINENVQVFADKNMTNTILRNLLNNAIKFTHKDGKITINAKKNGTLVTITVKDTGTGIRKEDLDKLFRIDTKFFSTGTADERGTGLGLLLCKEFIEIHGGKIWVESHFGKGSKFKFTLPLAN